MKILFTALAATMLITACGDLEETNDQTVADTSIQNLDVLADENDTVESSETDDSSSENLSSEEVSSQSDAATTEVQVDENTEQLPSDPTEDPDQEASYYEFPAWNIPSP